MTAKRNAALTLGVLLALLATERTALAQAHPSLYFTAEDLPALRARIRQEPFATRWRQLLANADEHLRRPARPQRGRLRYVRPSLGVAGTTAFAYAVTGERRYGERAKDELEALLAADRWYTGYSWNRGADLETAEAGVAAALVYDWCWDLFTPRERAAVRDGILAKCIGPYLRSVEQYRDWWVDNPVSNWCGVVHGGCGLAALALADESPQARRAAEHAWDHLGPFLRSVVLKDGGGHEGVMYWRYGVSFANYFYTAAARRRPDGRDLFDSYIEKLAGYWDLYMQGPDGRYANFNDMGERTFAGLYSLDTRQAEGGPNAQLCALFESLVPGGDPLLLWAADNGGSAFYWRGASPFYFLWRRDARPAGARPPLQPVVHFRGCGQAILRSTRLWLAFNGGWTSHRSHANRDLGTFVLVADAERLVHDPGYGATRTRDHSTVRVNGREQPENVMARYRRFGRGQGFAWLASDLSRCYPETDLTRWVRHIVVVEDAFVVLLDDLEAATPAQFEWRLMSRHAAAADGRGALVRGRATDLHVVAASPRDCLARAAPVSIETNRGAARLTEVVLRPGTARRSAIIVAVLYPGPTGTPAPQVQLGPDGLLEVATAGRRDLIQLGTENGELTIAAVNGEATSGIGTGAERSVERTGREPGPLP